MTVIPEDVVIACISQLPQPTEQIDYGCVRAVIRGEIRRRGVFPPEVGIDPEKFFRELARRGLEVYYTVKHFIVAA